MRPRAYYNENDPFAAQWLRNLIAKNLIAPGEVDERSIVDVRTDDVRGFVQCHFFAGIGVWSLALRGAGWSDERPIWTGSCPCQLFSVAGSGKGTADERHLWPVWSRLISECRPPVIVGEQVSSPPIVGDEGERFRVSTEVPEKSQGQGPGQTRPVEGSKEAGCVRPIGTPGRNSGTNIKGLLRGHRASAEPGWRSHLGQSLAGQNCPICGIRIHEHQDRLPCGEWSNGRLGRAESDRHGNGDLGEAQAGVKRLVDALGRNLAEAAGGAWLDLIQADLESAGYACGSCVLAAASVGAPHIRQRLYWMGHSDKIGRRTFWPCVAGAVTSCELERPSFTGGMADPQAGGQRISGGTSGSENTGHPALGDAVSGVGDPVRTRTRRDGGAISLSQTEGDRERKTLRREPDESIIPSAASGLADTNCPGQQWPGQAQPAERERHIVAVGASPLAGFWGDAEWLACTDGKARPVEPGTFPLAHGATCRVGRLRSYGNTIAAPLAAEFMRAVMEVVP